MSSKRMLQLVALICVCFSLTAAVVSEKGVGLDVEADVTVEVDVQVDLDTLKEQGNGQTKLDVDVNVEAEVVVDVDLKLDEDFTGAKVDIDIDILAEVDVTVDVNVYRFRDGEKQIEGIDVESEVDITTNANIDVTYLDGNVDCPEAVIDMNVDVEVDVEVDLNVKLTNECDECPDCVPEEETPEEETPEEETPEEETPEEETPEEETPEEETPEEETPEEETPEEETPEEETPEEETPEEETPEEETPEEETPEEETPEEEQPPCGCGGLNVIVIVTVNSALDCGTDIDLQYSKKCVGKCENINLDIEAISNVYTQTQVDLATNMKSGLFVDMNVDNKDHVRHDVTVTVVEECQKLGTCPEGTVPRVKTATEDEEVDVENLKVTSELEMDHKNKVKVTIHRGNAPMQTIPTKFRVNQAHDDKKKPEVTN